MSLAELYSALADPTRLKVLEMLHDKSRPVHELAGAFAISRPAISRHLRVLKQAGLVKEEKQGRENVYSFQRSELKAGIGWLEKHLAGKPAKAKKVKAKAQRAARPAPVAKPKAATVPKPMRQPTMPPAAPAPQLSFFDL